jgi:intracellular septation protein A
LAAARQIAVDAAAAERHGERQPEVTEVAAMSDHVAITETAGTPARARNVSVAALLLGSGPRFARDALAPVLVFYVGWRFVGLTPAIIGSTALALVIFAWERRRARTGLGAAIGLTIALTQAAAGLATGSAVAYFVPPIVFNTLYGLAFIGSVIIGRPLAGVFAQETYPFPPAVKASATFRRVFSRVSLAWGAYLLARSAVRLVTLSWGDVDLIVIVNVLSGIPFTAALTAWSIWYGVRGFRRSDEWREALRTATES